MAVVLGLTAVFAVRIEERRGHVVHPHSSHLNTTLPVKPDSYVGVYQSGAPESYAGVTRFAAKTGIKPRLVVYYSGWYEPFKTGFAKTVAEHGAVPLVQINPTGISLAAIASGHYDAYLTSYAEAVRSYRYPVILGFGHEMNGSWYSWGYRHSSPAMFVAAWRHIVTLFRELGARNVTWLWTANIMHTGQQHCPSGTLVARQQVRDVGRPGRLLLQTVLEVRSAVRADHRGDTPVHPCSDAHSRDVRVADHEPASEDRGLVRWDPPLRAAGLRLVQLRPHRGLAAQQPPGHCRVPPGCQDVPRFTHAMNRDRILDSLFSNAWHARPGTTLRAPH